MNTQTTIHGYFTLHLAAWRYNLTHSVLEGNVEKNKYKPLK